MHSLLALLQIAVSLLLSVQNNQVSDASKIKAIASATQTIGFVLQTLANKATAQYAQTPSTNIWPTADRLWSSLYLNREGKWVSLGSGVFIVDNSISFGDINNDNLDDAIVVTKNISANDPADITYHLTVMANQGGLLFNVANFDLGKTQPKIYSHSIESNIFTIGMENATHPRKAYRYKLLGNTLVEI